MTTEAQKKAFGAALAEALTMRQVTQLELGEQLPVRQSSVSAWKNGHAVPESPERVFEIERVLLLSPGRLSRWLGYRPVGAQCVSSAREAIETDELLPVEHKRVLLATLDALLAGGQDARPSA